MGYSALSRMQQINRERYGIAYPNTPQDRSQNASLSQLERSCLRFLHTDCEDLRFDPAKADLSDRTGKSVKPDQIPYNMEMDLDRLCMENAVHRFMASGTAQDAFDVYFCYLEMAVGNYAKSKKMIEMLAEFESNASALLMKHRDHYSHSVYVFILGCAIYAECASFRAAYRDFYHFEEERAAAHHFFKYWGLASLFHDIGYPFELPFEQVKSYFGNTIDGVPFVSYQGMAPYIQLSEAERAHFAALLQTQLSEGTLNEVLAVRLNQTLQAEYNLNVADTMAVFARKPSSPDAFNGYMDHAYFSAVLLFRQLMGVLGAERIGLSELDAFVAVALHNSMYKFSVRSKEKDEPLAQQQHPLAYLLMLCDELQCWDRTSYGQNSRRELHAMWCDLRFEGEKIHARYFFDRRLEGRKDSAGGTYPKMTNEQCSFLKDIEKIVRLNREDSLGLSIETDFAENNRDTKTYLSSSSFLHLYNFAVALNSRYQSGSAEAVDEAAMEEAFDRLSLEYKLSNVMQAKAFSRYLNAIGCFYTDKAVAYEMMDAFTAEDMDIIGPMEHERWVEEKLSMGWSYDTAYTAQEDSKTVRELTRTHNLIIPDFNDLNQAEQDKDTEPMNCMLKLIEQFDGLRIYRL